MKYEIQKLKKKARTGKARRKYKIHGHASNCTEK